MNVIHTHTHTHKHTMVVQHKPSGASATRDTRATVMALVGGVACGGAVQRPLLCISQGHEDYDAYSRYTSTYTAPPSCVQQVNRLSTPNACARERATRAHT